MDTRQLAKIDLNLLVALQVLLEECNVSNAADRLFVTQSAMSKTLGRLRDVFGDPLFTRSSHGMVPTPRALDIQKSLTRLLNDVQGLVAPQEFDPSSHRAEFRIAIPEYVGMAILPQLIERLQQEAPRMRIVAITRIEHQLDLLASGDLDFAIHVKHAHYGGEFEVDTIASLPPVLLVRQGHPLRRWKKEISSLEDLRYVVSNYPQVGLYVPDLDEVDTGQQLPSEIRAARSEVEVVFETSHMFSAIEVVRRTNCVLFGPPFITRHPALGTGVTSLKIQYGEGRTIEYVMAMHKRVAASAPHVWLRKKILELVKKLEKREQSGDPYSDYRVDRQLGFYSRNRKPDQ